MYKIVCCIVEDDPFIRENLSLLIQSQSGFDKPFVFANAEDFLESLPLIKPNIVLMDISLPTMNGIEAVKQARKIQPNLDIIMLTVHQEDHLVFESLCAGASGYLVKITQLSKIVKAIHESLSGGAPMSSKIAKMVVQSFHQSENKLLTNREKEVLLQLSKGKSYQMIADKLFVSKETIRTHIKKIYKKLEVHSSAEAVAKAYEQRLI